MTNPPKSGPEKPKDPKPERRSTGDSAPSDESPNQPFKKT